jgi:dimeric dUTPase (all-alpha-NTP-PPase superfamily)
MDQHIRKVIVNDMIESIPQSVKLQVRQEIAQRTALELQIRSIKLLADTQAFSNWLKKKPGGEPGKPTTGRQPSD